jgi:hypothetical protein
VNPHLMYIWCTWLSFETKAKASRYPEDPLTDGWKPAVTADSHCRPSCPGPKGSMKLR